MKKKLLITAAALGIGGWLIAQNLATPKPLSALTPAGAVLYLEAKNFSTLLGDWNSSAEKKTWLGGDNYQAFSRSQLYLKLAQVFGEYADGVGVSPDMGLLSSVAGGETALAIYDINKLEFLYLTRLPSARAMQSVLWKAKEKFAARNAAGVAYYVKTEPVKRRTAAFAIVGDLLLLATREDALVNALALATGANAPPITGETWFKEATAAAAGAGDLRMVTNIDKLVRTPAFRSYWIQRNGDDLAQYSSALDDLTKSAREVKEERLLLRADATPVPDTTAMPGLLKLARSAALYRAWAQPGPGQAASLIVRKVLRQGGHATAASKMAPGAAGEGGQIGDTNDLETRLDGAPFEAPGAVFRSERLSRALDANRAQALLHLESPGMTPDRVFVTTASVVAIEGTADWNPVELREALTDAVEGLYTTARIGAGWKQRTVGSETLWQMEGLAAIAMVVRGKTLLLANRAEPLEAVIPFLVASPDPGAATYAAGYRLAAEIATYTRLMRMIEFPQAGQSDPNEPAYFSANLGSLARTLQRVQNVSITARDDGRQVKQTVLYRLP